MNGNTAIIYNASSASPSFVSAGLNPDGRLAAKTEIVTLWGLIGSEHMAVYRVSSTAPGFLSADIYRLNAGAWEYVGEHSEKAPGAPTPPPGSVGSSVDGHDVWTRHEMIAEERVRLSELLKAPRKSKK
jgi:hypothetical protein